MGLLRIKRNPDPVDPGSWTWTEWAFDAVLAAVALEAETEALVTADAAFPIVDGLRTVSPGTREFDACCPAEQHRQPSTAHLGQTDRPQLAALNRS